MNRDTCIMVFAGRIEPKNSPCTEATAGQSSILVSRVRVRTTCSSDAPARSNASLTALLVIDEIGYLPVIRTGATLFFQMIARRYERASTVLTFNKSFEEWGEILGDEVMAAALIDRLLHHCHILSIRGNSYRMRHHTELWHQLQGEPSSTSTPPRGGWKTTSNKPTHRGRHLVTTQRGSGRMRAADSPPALTPFWAKAYSYCERSNEP